MEDKGYIDEATVIKATQVSERQPYDVVRQALKEVELDSSRRVELDDYVDVRAQGNASHFQIQQLILVFGSSYQKLEAHSRRNHKYHQVAFVG